MQMSVSLIYTFSDRGLFHRQRRPPSIDAILNSCQTRKSTSVVSISISIRFYYYYYLISCPNKVNYQTLHFGYRLIDHWSINDDFQIQHSLQQKRDSRMLLLYMRKDFSSNLANWRSSCSIVYYASFVARHYSGLEFHYNKNQGDWLITISRTAQVIVMILFAQRLCWVRFRGNTKRDLLKNLKTYFYT